MIVRLLCSYTSLIFCHISHRLESILMMKSSQQRVARNIPLLYITSFLGNFRLNAPILILYLQQQTGSFTAAMSLLSCLMIGASLLDIPTGALADLVGRKTSIVLGWIF